MTMRWVSTLALTAALSFSVFTGGCGGEAPATPAATAHGAPTEGLAAKLEATMKETLAPAAVVVVSSPHGAWSRAWGTRELGGGAPVTVDDHFRIGSNTKTMTGTVVLQLVDEGHLRLEDPISKFHAGIPNGDRITIAHLLEMRSGIPTYSNTVAINRALDEDPQRVWKPEELVRLALELPMSFEPGAGYEYSNTNTVLLGMVIERITKQPVEQVFKTRIFDRLGMRETYMPSRLSSAIPGAHPRGYMFGTNVETIHSQAFPPVRQADARAGRWRPIDATAVNPSWGWTAGAAISTAGDLAKYAEALGSGTLLSPEMHAKRMSSLRPRDPAVPEVQYGYGVAKLGPMVGHTGELPGFNSFMGYDPAHKTTVVVWTSLNAAPDGRPPAIEMARVVIDDLAKK
ncbi:MAG: beta-lactamase family protein [Deltaproteobacteria bacterium]|nr:beta-lactamase family protein [Deltaproteobacteria bacterium]